MKFEGIYTPAVTPFGPGGEIDRAGFADVLESLVAAGVHGIIIGGSTGEYYAQTAEERFDLGGLRQGGHQGPHRRSSSARARRGPRIRSTTRRHAQEIGADAILVASPPYALPTERENAVHALTIDRAANLPIMLYNYPARMGVLMGEDLSRPGRPLEELPAPSRKARATSTACTCWRASSRTSRCPAAWDDQALEFFAWGVEELGLRRLELPARGAHRPLRGLRPREELRQGPRPS